MPPHPTGTRWPSWMLSFADLLALLLAFFVLMFAMSSLHKDRWPEVAQSLERQFGGAPDRIESGRDLPRVVQPQLLDLGYLGAVMGDKLAADPVLARGVLQRLDDRVVLSLPADLLFASGEATPRPEALAAARVLADLLGPIGNRIEVHGHADPRPVRSRAFVSNWELSLARALAFAGALRAAGYRPETAVFGHGEAAFSGLPATLGLARRQELARRVDLVIREGGAGRRTDG